MPKTPKTPKSPEQTSPTSGREKARPEASYYVGIGRRKTATARVFLHVEEKELTIAGKKVQKGDMIVNGLPIDQYFNSAQEKPFYLEPFRTTNTLGRFTMIAQVLGSGKTGQLGAIVLGISRALAKVDPKFHVILRKKDLLTRDSRSKERKKPGLMGARKQKSSPKR